MPPATKSEKHEFVKGWHIVQTLGEGAFGDVRLLVEENTGEAVAVKVVDVRQHPESIEEMRKEMALQNVTNHINILKYKGCRTDGIRQYMFLEYAPGGELYDRIEPDVGMPLRKARFFFRQLLAGVNYLHYNGMVHRDLKPENLLLDNHDILKISDFGLATLFRFKAKHPYHNHLIHQERLLSKKCGTLPYVAPEVVTQSEYQAEPIDIWACGVILCAMLTGVLPFDEPTEHCRKFMKWKSSNNDASWSPWNRLDADALNLLKKILDVNVRTRLTLEEIRKSEWTLVKASSSSPDTSSKKSPSFQVQAGKMPYFDDDQGKILAQSQPPVETAKTQPDVCQVLSFSQPTRPEDMLISGELSDPGASTSGMTMQRQVRRITRVMVNTSIPKTIERLENIFTQNKYTYKHTFSNVITVSTVDARGTNLVFKVTVIELGGNVLIDFRLSKGCGLDFKRQFLRCKEGLEAFLVDGPITWNLAAATNSLPS